MKVPASPANSIVFHRIRTGGCPSGSEQDAEHAYPILPLITRLQPIAVTSLENSIVRSD